MSAPLLRVEGLGVRFSVGDWPRKKSLRALHDVSVRVDRGEVVALVGESGSGKSTLARALAGLVPAAAGRATLDGVDLFAPAAPAVRARRLQMIFQDPYASLNPAHPVGHAVLRPLRLRGLGAADVSAQVDAAFAAVGLSSALIGRLPQELSGGQRQRVAIARALVMEPALLLADEPTSMLDVSLRAGVLDLLARQATEHGRGLLLVTHDLASAWRVAHRAVVLYAGQLMEDGPAAEVLARPRHPYSRLLVAAARRDQADLRAPLPARPGRPIVIDPPPGCPFAPRCPLAEARCQREDPPLVELPTGARLRCHFPPVD